MTRKILFGSIWLTLVIYAVTFTIYANKSLPREAFQSDLDLIVNMTLAQWDGINPIIIAIFYIMGIFPWLYGALILFDSTEQKVSPYPFFVASIGFGAFALLPYFALRQPDTISNKQKNLLLKVLDSRLMAIVSSITIVVFLIWGLLKGNWSDFITHWHTSQFVNIMSIDFCLLCLLLPAVLKDDMVRRGVKQDKYFWFAALIPLLGSLIYWCVRPQLES